MIVWWHWIIFYGFIRQKCLIVFGQRNTKSATVQYEAVVMYVKMPSYYPSLKDRVDVCTNAASVVCKDLYQV